jgi:hypothetical protein
MAYRSLVRLGMAYATYAGIRRLSRRSGATDDEFYGGLPGDDVIAHPMGARYTSVLWPWFTRAGARTVGGVTVA